jgi:predicted DNA-binding transcriptional regulator AlpA
VTDQKKLVTTDEVTALTGRSRSKLYTVRLAGDFP